MPISSSRPGPPSPRGGGRFGAKSRAGFTLLEMLIVIAIIGLVAALTLPNLARMISNNTAQTVFFEFQNQMTELRAQAYRQRRPLLLVSSGEFADDPEAEPSPVEIQFIDADWTYRLSEPVEISAGGTCSPATAEIFQDDRLALTLEARADCVFVRVVG